MQRQVVLGLQDQNGVAAPVAACESCQASARLPAATTARSTDLRECQKVGDIQAAPDSVSVGRPIPDTFSPGYHGSNFLSPHESAIAHTFWRFPILRCTLCVHSVVHV